jgi:hypothetical protein
MNASLGAILQDKSIVGRDDVLGPRGDIIDENDPG